MLFEVSFLDGAVVTFWTFEGFRVHVFSHVDVEMAGGFQHRVANRADSVGVFLLCNAFKINEK